MKARHLATVTLLATIIPLSAQIEVVSGGNVGVGTTSPGNKFTVEGTGDVASFGSSTKKFYFASDTNGVALFTGAGKAGNGLYADAVSSYFALSTNSAERLRIDSSGRMGLGTTVPSFPLSFGTSIGNKIALYDVGGGAGYGFGIQGSLLQIFTNTSADRVGIGYGNSGSFTETLTVRGSNVGIGTTSPSQKLEVAGSVRATSFISNSTTYADFVFDPDYQLPALSEVAAKIKELGHLPGIPSEAEAREHGIDLAAMQVKLLQKIEELTLHQIAQEREIAALKRQLNSK